MKIFAQNEIQFTTTVPIFLYLFGQNKSRKQEIGSFGTTQMVQAGVTATQEYSLKNNIIVRNVSSGARLSRFKI